MVNTVSITGPPVTVAAASSDGSGPQTHKRRGRRCSREASSMDTDIQIDAVFIRHKIIIFLQMFSDHLKM